MRDVYKLGTSMNSSIRFLNELFFIFSHTGRNNHPSNFNVETTVRKPTVSSIYLATEKLHLLTLPWLYRLSTGGVYFPYQSQARMVPARPKGQRLHPLHCWTHSFPFSTLYPKAARATMLPLLESPVWARSTNHTYYHDPTSLWLSATPS
jgi:hypothetical protein